MINIVDHFLMEDYFSCNLIFWNLRTWNLKFWVLNMLVSWGTSVPPWLEISIETGDVYFAYDLQLCEWHIQALNCEIELCWQVDPFSPEGGTLFTWCQIDCYGNQGIDIATVPTVTLCHPLWLQNATVALTPVMVVQLLNQGDWGVNEPDTHTEDPEPEGNTCCPDRCMFKS